MKAAVYYSYGGPEVVRIADVPKPEPRSGEVLVRIRASAVNAADWRLRRADPWMVRLLFGLFKPKKPILGVVFAGEVEAIGKDVTKYAKGDRLFGWTGLKRMAGHAEYICLPQDGPFTLMPTNMDFADAAAIPFGGATALDLLRKAAIKKGQQVLVYGASGAAGTAAVQLARQMGAEVTGVCSTRNVELVRTLGASTVLDYTKDDLTAIRDRYDVVFETVGKLPFATCLGLLKPGGVIVLGSEMPADTLRRPFRSKDGKKPKVVQGLVREREEDMRHLKSLIERNELRAVIDTTYPLERIAEAHALAESGHKRGNLVITM
ncbi:MAG: NAD(P)-dependent alcohol dehydrogenase [Flavobacteriales bacterium]